MIYNTSYINKTRLYYMTVLQMLVAVKMMHPAASRMYLDSCLHLFLKSVYVRMPMLRLFRALATLPDPGPVHWIRTSQNSFFEAPFCFCFLTLASNHNHNCTPSLKRTLRTTATLLTQLCFQLVNQCLQGVGLPEQLRAAGQ